MGIADRDYMRERRDPPFTPPADVGAGTLFSVLLVCAMVFGGYKGYGWYLERQAAGQRQTQPGPKAPATFPVNPPVVAPLESGRESPRAWTRCTVNGKVLYSDSGCPGSAQGGPLRSAPAAATTEGSVPASTHTLYHCKAYSGGTFWTTTHCNQHKALVDRIVDVPAQLSFDQQVAMAEGRRQAAQLLQSQVQTTVAPAPKNADHSQECQSLDRQILRWDAIARQPQSAATQDRIREKRKEARDRQFALHC